MKEGQKEAHQKAGDGVGHFVARPESGLIVLIGERPWLAIRRMFVFRLYYLRSVTLSSGSSLPLPAHEMRGPEMISSSSVFQDNRNLQVAKHAHLQMLSGEMPFKVKLLKFPYNFPSLSSV